MKAPPKIPDRPFTFAQARQLGFSRTHLDRLVASGRVVRVLRGVYQAADLPDTITNRACAAALVLSPFSVVCDRTAAWIHGVDVLRHHELDVLPPVETVRLRGHGRVKRAGCVGGERDLAWEDVEMVAGVLVTTPLRTALDLGCLLPRGAALAALDAIMRQCRISREALWEQLGRYAGRRGVVQLRELVGLVDERAESPGESLTRLALIDAGLPTPVSQYWVTRGGRRVYRVDLAYPHCRLAIEYDGEEHHSSAEQREHDRRRREWLERVAGWKVIVVTRQTLEDTDWLLEVRNALRQAA